VIHMVRCFGVSCRGLLYRERVASLKQKTIPWKNEEQGRIWSEETFDACEEIFGNIGCDFLSKRCGKLGRILHKILRGKVSQLTQERLLPFLVEKLEFVRAGGVLASLRFGQKCHCISLLRWCLMFGICGEDALANWRLRGAFLTAGLK